MAPKEKKRGKDQMRLPGGRAPLFPLRKYGNSSHTVGETETPFGSLEKKKKAQPDQIFPRRGEKILEEWGKKNDCRALKGGFSRI